VGQKKPEDRPNPERPAAELLVGRNKTDIPAASGSAMRRKDRVHQIRKGDTRETEEKTGSRLKLSGEKGSWAARNVSWGIHKDAWGKNQAPLHPTRLPATKKTRKDV